MKKTKMKKISKKELKKHIKLPKHLNFLYDIPIYIEKGGRKRYSYLFTLSKKKDKSSVEIFKAEIVIANKHTKPYEQLISTICHEWAHYLCIRKHYDFRHSKKWTKIYKSICPESRFWKFEKQYLK